MNTVPRVFAYLRRYPWMALGTLGCAILSTLMVVVFPAVTKLVIDEVLTQHRADRLTPLVLIAALALVLQHGLNSLRIILNNTFEQKVIFDLRSDLYSHIQMLPLRWFDNRATGDLMTRILEDVNSVERMLIDGIEQGVVAVLQLVIVLGMMFYFSVSLTLVGLAPMPFLAGGALWYTLTAHRRYRLARRASSAMNSLLHDNLAGIRQIKSFVREREQHSRFNSVSDQLRHATLVVMRVWALYHPSMILIGSLGIVVTVWFGARAVLSGGMQVGDLIAFLMLTGFLYEPINKLHQLNQLVQAGRAAGERVFEIIDEPIEPGWDVTKETVRVSGDVRFEDVGFNYSADGAPALQQISFHARPGETIALVGTTGAGKSTLVNLLTRFYEYETGEILIDGTPIREFGTRRLREMIAVVTQESFLFNGTIRENLLMGKPDGDGRGGAGRGRGGERARVHRSVAEGIEQRRGRARSEAKRGRKTTAFDRARAAERPADSHSRRSDRERGQRHGALDPGSAGAPDVASHLLRDRAPALHHSAGGSDSGPGERTHYRAGHACVAARAGRKICAALGTEFSGETSRESGSDQGTGAEKRRTPDS